MICPRCPGALPLSTWRVPSPEGDVELQGCDTCQGLYLTKAQQKSACPTVSHLPDHVDEVALTGKAGAGIGHCPACNAVPFQVELVGVWVDFCVSCLGVWLDGSDYQEAAFEPDRAARARAPYREEAGAALAQTQVKCVYCERLFEPNELMFWEHGRICRGCKQVRDVRAAEREQGTSANSSWLDQLVSAILRS